MYYTLNPAADAKKIEFDFSGMEPRDMLDVDLLIKTKGSWSRRPGSDEPICNAEQIIVVLANHDIARGAKVTGTWSVLGTNEPCNDGNWTVTLTGPKAGAGTYSGRADYVTCSTDSAGNWSVDFQTDLTGDILGATASVKTQFISVVTRYAIDDPEDWDWQGGFTKPGSMSITGDTSKEPWTAHVDAAWNDAASPDAKPIPLKVSMDVVCNVVYMGP
jgi:hypothetical protein